MPVVKSVHTDGSNATSASPEVLKRGASGVVSWLRAAALTFPADKPVVLRARVVMPDTVAGPHRLYTGFRGSVSRIDCERSLSLPK